MILQKTTRPGGALVEVLIGFGILGIAATSVITLFPFAALTVGKALQDDRTTTCAVMADGQMRDVHARYVVGVGHSSTEPYFTTMNSTGAGSGPSTPVYVDPMGSFVSSSVGDGGATSIPRVNLSFLTNQSVALRYCSLMDSLNFDEGGKVQNGIYMREMRYNYAWMLQQPSNNDPFTVRMQVVVYNKRKPLYAPPGTEAPFGNITFTPGSTAILGVPTAADIRTGTWVLATGGTAVQSAEFYRVVSATNMGTSLSLELHRPITRIDGSTAAFVGTLVVMPTVADVFDRPNLTGTFGR